MANQNFQNPGDILGQSIPESQRSQNQEMKLLNSIDSSLKQMIREMSATSQANAINSGYSNSIYSYRNPKYSTMRSRTKSFDEEYDPNKIAQGMSSELARSIIDSKGLRGIFRSVINNLAGPVRRSVTDSVYDLLDGIEHALKEGAGKADFQNKLSKSIETLAKDLGVEKGDIKKALGRELGKRLLQNSDFSAIAEFWKDFRNRAIDDAQSIYGQSMYGTKSRISNRVGDVEDAQEAVKDAQDALNKLYAQRDRIKAYESGNPSYLSNESSASETAKAERETSSEVPSSNSSSHDIFLLINDISVFTESIQYNTSQIASMLSRLTGYELPPASTIEESATGSIQEESEISNYVSPQTSTTSRIPSNSELLQLPQISVNELNKVLPESPFESELSHGEDVIASGETNPRIEDEIAFAEQELAAHQKRLEFLQNVREENATNGVIDVGKYFGEGLEKILNSNSLTSKLYGGIKESGTSIFGDLKESASKAFSSGKDKYIAELGKGLDPSKMSGLNGMISTLTGGAAGATEAGAALSGLTNVVSALGPEAMLAVVGFKLVSSTLKKAFQPALEGAKKTINAAEAAIGRFHTSNLKNIENSQKRLIADINTLVQTPFEILRKGAEEWYNTWDKNLRTITATQGYTKSDLQNLMAAFADRLRQENLTSVVSATDITNNLTKVLESGLSGSIAEEFAYIATKLNAAVPTQDFFSYAETYASSAANAVRIGMTQADAIEYANQQLTAFANNLLYASREVAGGFTTGLKNAESLFKQSVQIAQAGKTYNATEISGVLTAVSAITGAIAPDLAQAMTDAIYKAAVGGNSNEIVALRSLAGVNASNTEFLQALTSNPKQVFSDLFNELAKRQNMSEDAYMEVAEGLSSIFGVSADTFARVDFAYLAQAIESMDTSSKALIENMLLLKSGETTTNAEQLKMQEINKQILDEGLSYVLDNEAARAIQQHMWDEQLAREMQETEYGVNLHGAALELLEGIRSAVDVIATILNPVKLIGKIANLFAASEERQALEADVEQVLELGKVGAGNAISRYNLVTRNENLNLVQDLTDMLGGKSNYRSERETLDWFNKNPMFNTLLTTYSAESQTSDMAGKTVKSNGNIAPKSKFQWNTVGKSQLAALLGTSSPNVELQGIDGIRKVQSPEKVSENVAIDNMQKMLDSMQEFVQNSPESSYEEWVSTAKQFGISDYKKVVEESGLTENQIASQYSLLQAQIEAQKNKDREKREEEYWDDTQNSMNNSSVSLGTIKAFAESFNADLGAIKKYTEVTQKAATNASDNIIAMKDKTSEIKELLAKMQTSLPDLSGIENKIGQMGDILNGIQNQLHVADDNRPGGVGNTGLDLDVSGWLRFIYYQLSGDGDGYTQGALNQIAANTMGGSSNESANAGNANVGALIGRISDLINVLSSQAGYASPNSPLSDSLRGQATGGYGYLV